jgi:hypothetical protein
MHKLLKRVKAATGPDRELDDAICFALGWLGAPNLTESLEATIALVEEVLPGWVISHIGADAAGRPGALRIMGWTAELSNGGTTVQGQSGDPVLALLIAALTALEHHK